MINNNINGYININVWNIYPNNTININNKNIGLKFRIKNNYKTNNLNQIYNDNIEEKESVFNNVKTYNFESIIY